MDKRPMKTKIPKSDQNGCRILVSHKGGGKLIFHQMGLREPSKGKKKLRAIPYININSKWRQNFNAINETLEVLEESTEIFIILDWVKVF